MTSEITIIGSGMAAVAAATELLGRGARVTMVRGRPGATALTSGAWDIAGDLLRHPGQTLEEIRPAAENLKEILRRRPDHPYSLMAQNLAVEDLPEFLAAAIERVASSLAIRLKGGVHSPFVCTTPLGTPRPTSYVGRGPEAGNLLTLKDPRLLVVGLRGLAQFSAPLVSSFLKKRFPQTQGTVLDLKKLPPVSAPIDCAQRLDEDEVIAELGSRLSEVTGQARPTGVVLPPVMGIERHDHLLSVLHEATGIPCFETLGLLPSVPGLRLQRAIDRLLSRGAIRMIEGEAVGFEGEGRRIRRITVRHEEEKEELVTDRILLATGRFVGGGIVYEGSFEEPLFHLPVFSNRLPVSKISVGKMVGGSFFSEHPLMAVGLRVTRNLQPVVDNGRLAYENLWAAGSVIGGSDPITEMCGMGVAIGTGTLAARMVLT